jgi:hypothetical protein
VSSIRDAVVGLDTNEFVFALRQDPRHPTCETILFDRLGELKVCLPLQILAELQRNLSTVEMRTVLRALERAGSITWDYAPAPPELIKQWVQRGAKKGDAVIAAHLEAHRTRYFISENRHFLTELPDLPFDVLAAEEVVRLLDQ